MLVGLVGYYVLSHLFHYKMYFSHDIYSKFSANDLDIRFILNKSAALLIRSVKPFSFFDAAFFCRRVKKITLRECNQLFDFSMFSFLCVNAGKLR